MAQQNYVARPVTQINPSAAPARVTRSSATAASLAQISGLNANEVSPFPPVHIMDEILALPLHELHAKLETATSDELRSLRAHIGMGKAGTKEANKTLIYEQVQQRRAAIAEQAHDIDVDDDSFADTVRRSATSANSDGRISLVDPFVKDDPWRGQAAKIKRLAAFRDRIAKPIVDTRRSSSAHSGLSPELIRKQHALTDSLCREGPMLQPLDRVPEFHIFTQEGPPDPLHSMLSSLVSGMNEVRATLSHVVTRDDLRALHEAQSAEMKTYVQAETAPLHAGIAQLSTDFQMVAMDAVDHDERIDKLETNITELQKRVDSHSKLSNLQLGAPHGSGAIDKNDPNHCRISFKGFTSESLDSRCDTVKQFETKFQGKDTFVCIDTRMSGPYSARKPTNETFVQFCSRDARDRVFQALKDSEIKTAKGNPVKVSKSKPDFIRTRDWAMGKSEELIKAKLETAKISATVKFEKGKEVRRITVNGCDAFVQRFADARGTFVGSFDDLELP